MSENHQRWSGDATDIYIPLLSARDSALDQRRTLPALCQTSYGVHWTTANVPQYPLNNRTSSGLVRDIQVLAMFAGKRLSKVCIMDGWTVFNS